MKSPWIQILLVGTALVGVSAFGLCMELADRGGYQRGLADAGPTQTHRLDSRLMVASWYGMAMDGRTTASGERFDAMGMTCASRTLPFGTRLLVGLNGKWAELRVTDRGPLDPNRDLDLSEGAAMALGFKKSGLAIVRVIELEGDIP